MRPAFLTARELKTHEEFGTYMYPETYIINAQGRVLLKIAEPADWTSPAVTQIHRHAAVTTRMVLALFLYLALANDVRDMIAHNDLAAAERTVQASRAQSGDTPEFAAALSWLARGELLARQYDRADAYAVETRKLADELLRTRKLDSDQWLPTAVGAAIEVHAQVLAAHGARSDAVTFLNEQLALFGNTSIGERLHKNLNLLSLEGKAGAGAR